MSIYKASIYKPVTTLLIFVAVLVIGVYSYQRLPIDQFPEMDPPYITVMTTYFGANASEIETNVTRLLENSLNSVDGLKEITSTSRDNMSVILLELQWGINLDEITNDVRSLIDMTKDNLPSGASTPVVFKFSSSTIPIIQYAVTAKESYAGLDKILNNDVIPQLNRVDGVGNISLSGSPERYVYIEIDQEKLDAFNIPLETIGNAIGSNNLNLSAGIVKMQKEQYQLQTHSEYAESGEIADIVVTTTPAGEKIYVRDIATLRDTIKDVTLDEKINGEEGVRIMISKQSGGNTVQICEDLNKEMEKIKKTLPSDIEVEVIYDSSEDIQNSINSLQESILYALLFVVIVVLFFLGRWRATFIIALTIPISLIVAFIYLAVTGSSLNIISLSALTVAIGMVVDDAIVVLENIVRHVERGATPRDAAKSATNEVWVAVIATTLVIVVVFVPLTLLEGMAGIMFKELGWIVAITVSTSTVVAISLTPMLASKLLKSKEIEIGETSQIEEKQSGKTWYEKNIGALLNKVDKWYANVLRLCLNHKRITLITVILFFAVSLIPMFSGMIGTDFMQQSDNGRLTAIVELNTGTSIDETIKTARRLEKRFVELVPEIRMISTTAGSNDDASISALFSNTVNYTIEMTIVCNKKNERERSITEIAEVLRQEMAAYPEIVVYQAQPSGMGMSGGVSTVDVEIYGYDIDRTNILAENIQRVITEKISGARDVTISRDRDRAELRIIFDKEKLALHGLTSATVASFMQNRVNGMSVGYLKEEGDEYPIIVRMEEDNRNAISKIENLTIPTAAGNIRLSEVGTVEVFWSLPTIDRKNRQRTVSVQAVPYGISLGELAVEIEKVLAGVDIPQGVSIRLAGDYEDQQETFADMGLLLLMIIMLVYIVMASQFESFRKPLIIMISVPFALSGVILALFITGTTLDMIGALGTIMLVGIVVKNGIVLVDYINLMRDRGYELNEAIALSGLSRLRPVLMTAFTTILGMLPMALSQGEGSEMWQPMGIVVIGGLLVSTIVTLIIVPVLYGYFSRHGERNIKNKISKEFTFLQLPENK